MMTMKVTGLKVFDSRVKAVTATVLAETRINALRAGLFVQRKSQQLVPVDTGNLKNSVFTRDVGGLSSPDVIVGYTAEYAIYVHENLDAAHNAGQSAKFLEKPIRENRSQILKIMSGK